MEHLGSTAPPHTHTQEKKFQVHFSMTRQPQLGLPLGRHPEPWGSLCRDRLPPLALGTADAPHFQWFCAFATLPALPENQCLQASPLISEVHSFPPGPECGCWRL